MKKLDLLYDGGEARREYSSQSLFVRGHALQDARLVTRDRPDDANMFSRVNKGNGVVLDGDWGSEFPKTCTLILSTIFNKIKCVILQNLMISMSYLIITSKHNFTLL